MTGKIPVGGTIARAYGFAFGNIVNNFGAIWLPVVLLWAATFFIQRATGMSESHDPAKALAMMPLLFLLSILSLVLQSAQVAALTKEALGLRTGSAFLQFPFGAATWRVLGSTLLFVLVMIIFYIGLILVTAIVAGIGIAISKTFGAILIFVVLAALLCAFLYIATRLSFFLAPVSVAEQKVSLVRAWQLTGGNFWRIFAVMFVILVPVVILELAFLGMLFAPIFHSLHANMTPQEITALQQQFVQNAGDFTNRWWFVSYPVGLLVTLLFYGMYTGAASYAYRAVAEHSEAHEVF